MLALPVTHVNIGEYAAEDGCAAYASDDAPDDRSDVAMV
jgi:hypothetical protein